MYNRYGLTDAEWESAVEEITNLLQARARDHAMITYSDLVQQMKTIRIGPRDPALGALLGEVSQAEAQSGRGMLSVLVVHKYGDQEPGPGFFELAEALGRNTSDQTTCWVSELKRVFAYWRDVDRNSDRL